LLLSVDVGVYHDIKWKIGMKLIKKIKQMVLLQWVY